MPSSAIPRNTLEDSVPIAATTAIEIASHSIAFVFYLSAASCCTIKRPLPPGCQTHNREQRRALAPRRWYAPHRAHAAILCRRTSPVRSPMSQLAPRSRFNSLAAWRTMPPPGLRHRTRVSTPAARPQSLCPDDATIVNVVRNTPCGLTPSPCGRGCAVVPPVVRSPRAITGWFVTTTDPVARLAQLPDGRRRARDQLDLCSGG